MKSNKPTPSFLDYLDLSLLRISKRRRSKIENDSDNFYESFFTVDDIVKYECDVRNEWRFNVMQKLLSDVISSGEGIFVDVGCGLGFSSRFIPGNFSYKGIEFSEQTFNFAKNLHSGVKNTEFIQGGFPRLPIEDSVADFVICTEVIEHIEDDGKAISELYRILKPGGYLWITVPSTYYWQDYFRLIGHYRHYTGTLFSKQLENCGFEIHKRIPQFNKYWRYYQYTWVLMQIFEKVCRATISKELQILKTKWYQNRKNKIISKLENMNQKEKELLTSTSILVKKSV
ncbi:hypothetical protein MNBD_ALPHA03-2016 [hydrothermal vent metagenome]|uniref:Methyltransferase type 11 domain-containing protein n=1 Tax=hydrothermal vent metagenome TaxID=652676 RepID=A0A3B1BIF3_9ZZZZ